ncbi:MAG: T9SS type A sorting domain-containing protein, partial [Marinoscillum sp.]
MKSYFFAIVSFLFYTWCNGQTVYSGRVYDAGTLHPVQGAEITLSSTNQTTHTNFSADFLIKYGESEQSAYQFFHNSVFWSEPQGTEIMITSLEGKVMLQDQVVGTYYLLPTLNKGMYVLSLTQANHAQSFKIMSYENETIKVDKRGIFHLDQSSGERSDTLTVSKEGYYEREIVVSSKSQKLNIALLKGDYQNLKYLQELVSPLAFDVVSSQPSRSNLGDVQEAKIVYDRNTRSIYYMNSKRYELHYTFSAEVLGYNKGHGQFNLTQYRNNPDRYLFLAGLFYYKAIDTYVLQFVTAVEMTCTEVEELYQKILETSFLTRENLKFYPNKVEWEKCNQLPLVSSEELYAGQTYQGLNLAENYGYLRKIRSEQILTTYLSRRDMV